MESVEETLKRVGDKVRETDDRLNPKSGRRNQETRPGKDRWNRSKQSKDALDRPVRGKKKTGGKTGGRRWDDPIPEDKVKRANVKIRRENIKANLKTPHPNPNARLKDTIQKMYKEVKSTYQPPDVKIMGASRQPAPAGILRNPGDSVTLHGRWPDRFVPHAQAPTPVLSKPNPKLPMYMADEVSGAERAHYRDLARQRKEANTVERAVVNKIKSLRATGFTKEGIIGKVAGKASDSLYKAARSTIGSGAIKGIQKTVNNATVRKVAKIAGSVARSPVTRAVGKVAVPVGIVADAYTIGVAANEGVKAAQAYTDAKHNEAAMTERYGTVEAATRTRHALEAAKRKRKKDERT